MNVTLNRITKIVALPSFLLGALFLSIDARAAQVATLEQVQGEVLVHAAAAPAEEWKAVTGSTVLNDGDSVKTANGTAVLTYTDQATMEIANNTAFTVKEQDKTQDINLTLGKFHAKVNHDKVTKPFQIVTPVGVAAVRGTDVDFSFDSNGQLTVDLHNGNIQVINEGAELTLDLDGGKKITLKYVGDVLSVGNDCGSGGSVSFSAGGQSYSLAPCDSQNVSFETAAGENTPPSTESQGNPGENNPNENQENDQNDDVPPPVSQVD